MIKLGVNSVLFGKFSFATAAEYIAKSGYDGLEISAIKGMCEHLELDRWQEQAAELKSIMADNNLEFFAMEEAAHDEERLMKAFEAGATIGIPIINIGPGGKPTVGPDGQTNDDESFKASVEFVQKMAEKAEDFGVILCMKAHVGAAIYNTPTTLRALEGITSPAFGVDMDPSHIFRGQENPEEELAKVVSKMKHVHIRDCVERVGSPGTPPMQACGRGNINLFGYCKALVDGGYSGPVDLEVIGAGDDMTLADVSIIAAESYGYLNACFKKLGAR